MLGGETSYYGHFGSIASEDTTALCAYFPTTTIYCGIFAWGYKRGERFLCVSCGKFSGAASAVNR